MYNEEALKYLGEWVKDTKKTEDCQTEIWSH